MAQEQTASMVAVEAMAQELDSIRAMYEALETDSARRTACIRKSYDWAIRLQVALDRAGVRVVRKRRSDAAS